MVRKGEGKENREVMEGRGGKENIEGMECTEGMYTSRHISCLIPITVVKQPW